MSQVIPERSIAGTPDDPAWPRNCAANLNRSTSLPGGFHSTIFACRSVDDAKAMAEENCGVKLSWEESRRRSGPPKVSISNDVPYRGGCLYYTIWDWS
jgi:hypothetical protein